MYIIPWGSFHNKWNIKGSESPDMQSGRAGIENVCVWHVKMTVKQLVMKKLSTIL